MKNTLILAVGILSFLSACKKGAVLEIPSPSHRFGEVYVGEDASHSFAFKNAGDEDLVIKSINSSCGCTIAQVWVDQPNGSRRTGNSQSLDEVLRVQPGESGQVQISIATKTIAGPEIQRSGTITLTTNEKGKGFSVLQYTIVVDKPYTLEKESLDIGVKGRLEKTTFQIKIQPAEKKTFNISKVLMSHPGLHGDIEKKNDGDHFYYLFSAQAGPDLPPGSFQGNYELVTDLPRQHRIVIPVYGIVQQDIVINPPYFQFPMLSRGSEGTAEIEVLCTDPNLKLEILPAKVEGANADQFQTELKTVEAGKKYLVTLKSSSKLEANSFRGNVVLETNDPRRPRIEVPYRGFMK